MAGGKFDENKDKYWLGTLKWQQKSQQEKTGATPTTPPTLVQKKKGSRRHHNIVHFSDEEDDNAPLQCRAQHVTGHSSDEDSPPLALDPALPAEAADLLARAGTGVRDVFSDLPRPLRTSDAAAHYHALQILHPPDSDESDDSV